MKTIVKFNTMICAIGLALGLFSCKNTETSPVDSYGADYDIQYPYPIIADFPATADVGTNFTVTGVNLDNKIRSVTMGVNTLDTVSTHGTYMVVKLPRIFTKSAITVTNVYRKTGTSVKTVSPIYPEVKITKWPDFFWKLGGSFQIEGENVDLITEVTLGSTKVAVKGGTSSTSQTIRTDGFNTSAEKATGRVTKTLGTLNQENITSDSLIVYLFDPTKIPPVSPTVLWNYENDVTDFTAGDIVPSQGINLSAIDPSTSVTGTKYFTVKAENVPSQWSTLIGFVERAEPIVLSRFNKEPHLTFLVNTNGKNGYAQVEISQGDIRAGAHFTGTSSNVPTDDYNFGITNGWEWRSVAFSKFNWENWFGDGPLTFDNKADIQNFKLSFKQGNGGNDGNKSYEINLDQIMITDGPYPYPE